MFNTKHQINKNNNNENNLIEKTDIFKETYLQKAHLGTGSYGRVYLIQSTLSHIDYVCKNIDLTSLTEEEEKASLNEVSVLKKCNHPNIIKFKEAFITKKPVKKLHLITEYANEGDLEKKLKSQKQKNEYFSEKQIINWLIQSCLALKYIHKLHVIHRDIKPSNIFLTKNGIIKIGDFGISKILMKNHKKTKAHIGTPIYMAPEVINSESYDYEVDIWSLGITFFELMTFHAPFKGNNQFGLFNNIINGIKYVSFNNVKKLSFSMELINIINKMISHNSSQRPTIDDILKVPVIQHNLKEFLENNKDLYKNVNLDLYENEYKNNNIKNKSEDIINKNLSTISEEDENQFTKNLTNFIKSKNIDKLFQTEEILKNNEFNITNQKQLYIAKSNALKDYDY